MLFIIYIYVYLMLYIYTLQYVLHYSLSDRGIKAYTFIVIQMFCDLNTVKKIKNNNKQTVTKTNNEISTGANFYNKSQYYAVCIPLIIQHWTERALL